MIQRHVSVLRLTFAVLATIAATGSSILAAPPAPGSYELSFYNSVNGELEPVSSLPVCTQSGCEELILEARVEDSSGFPAEGGLVTFQYCSLKGLPSNDISRPDEAPKAACQNRSAAWSNLGTYRVDEAGTARYVFGIVRIPRTVGFRFSYSRGSNVAKGTSAPTDFVWTPGE